MKKLILGGLAAGAVALGIVTGAPAQADPTTTAPAPAPGWSEHDIQKAICDNSYWRHQFPADCARLGL